MSFGALFPLGGLAPVAHVQHTNTLTNATSVTFAFASAPLAANTVVLVAFDANGSGGVRAATATVGGSAITRQAQGGTTGSYGLFWGTGFTGTSIVVSGLAASAATIVFALEFSAVAASPLDGTVAYAEGTAGSIQPGSRTPSLANELVIAASYVFGATTGALPSGFTDGGTNTGGGTAEARCCYQIQTSAAATNPTFTDSGGGFTGWAVQFDFKNG